jgi:urease accessory protein
MRCHSSQIARTCAFLLFLSLAMFPQPLYAHPGHADTGGETGALLSGILHPLTGLDHLLAMIAVGLWAAQLGGRATLLVPASFVGVMMLGAVLGVSGVSLPYVESGIIASVLILGIAVAIAVRPPLYIAAAAAAGLLALFHGHAHGTELPVGMSALSYGTGFVVSTIGLHMAGIGLGLCVQGRWRNQLPRAAGIAITAAGVLLLVSAR